MPQTYKVTAYITRRVETLVVTDDEDMVSELTESQILDGNFKLRHEDIEVYEYEPIHDANID